MKKAEGAPLGGQSQVTVVFLLQHGSTPSMVDPAFHDGGPPLDLWEEYEVAATLLETNV